MGGKNIAGPGRFLSRIRSAGRPYKKKRAVGEKSRRKRKLSRRHVLGGALAVGAAGFAGLSAGQSEAAPRPSGKLPERGNFVIRGAYVMPMEGEDIFNGDVHVKD